MTIRELYEVNICPKPVHYYVWEKDLASDYQMFDEFTLYTYDRDDEEDPVDREKFWHYMTANVDSLNEEETGNMFRVQCWVPKGTVKKYE